MTDELRMNLQLFSEEAVEESVETVDNVEETPSQEFGAGAEEELAAEQGTEEEQQSLDFTPFLKHLSENMKYNGESVTVGSIEDLITGYQKSLNYDKILEKSTGYESQLNELNPQAQFAKQLAEKYGFKDVGEYQKAVEEQWKKDEIDSLIQNNIPEEYAKEMIDNRRFREQYGKEKEEHEKQQAESQRYTDFVDWHAGMVKDGVFNEALDVNAIPQGVWEIYARNGDNNIKSAYMEYQLTAQRGEIQQETLKKIQQNGETSVGSINSDSAQEPSKMSREQVDKVLSDMSTSQRNKWIDANMENLEKWGYFKNF